MKKTQLLLAIIYLAITSINAQQIADSIVMGASNTNDVFYSLENGDVSSSLNTEWDFAFNTSLFSASIRINDGRGVELYTYPNGDTAAFATLDTTNMTTWQQARNSWQSWEGGAFNSASNGGFDYGWGVYNPATHYVTGDSIYVIKTTAGEYKKIWIESLKNGAYNFKYSDLDNSNTEDVSILLANYSSKNYFYYDADNQSVVNREPDTSTWDFVATKYLAPIPQGGYYSSTGIISNKGVKTREARGVNSSTAQWGDFTEKSAINVIGYDWKSFNMTTFSYDIEEDLSYFVTDKMGNIWQVIFTGFGGASDGKIFFTKEMVSAVSIDENRTINLGIYPNPTNTDVSFLYNNLDDDDANIFIYDLQGKMVYTKKFIGKGFNQQTISVSFLNAGVYTVVAQSKNRVGTQKLIIK